MLTGIILTGGAGGMPMRPLDGGSFIERQIETMRPVCADVLVVTDNPRPLLAKLGSSVRIVTDFFPGMGPLGGLHAGLTLARQDLAWVVGGDMPYISREALAVLQRYKEPHCDAVLPTVNGAFYPLCGLYDTQLAAQAQTMLENGETGMPAFLRNIRWREVPESAFVQCDLRFVTVVRDGAEQEEKDSASYCDYFHNVRATEKVNCTHQDKEG